MILAISISTVWPSLCAAAAAALLLLSIYSYVGYPLIVRFLVAPRKRPAVQNQVLEWPMLSALVSAYNEANVIEKKVRNLLDQNYPRDRLEVLVVSDASDDGTDEIVRALADPRVRLFKQEVRSGKTAGINRLGREARGEIFVQTDANAMFADGTLRALAAPFQDPDVGMTLGEVVFTNADDPEVAAGEGLYWRFESWTKRVEAARDLLVVASGAIYAIRRTAWQELPENVDGDAVEPLLVARQGLARVNALSAVARERAAASLSEEFWRKARIIARQVAGARWIRLRTLPPRIVWAYGSHKLMRYAVPFLSFAALILGIAAWLGGSTVGAALTAMISLPLIVAPFGLLPWPRSVHRITWIPLFLVIINLAAVVGVLRGLRGNAPVAWNVPASTRTASAADTPRESGSADRVGHSR